VLHRQRRVEQKHTLTGKAYIMKKKTSKAQKTQVKVKDLKPKKSPKGGQKANTIGGRAI
jgi:hypothetical protein